MKYYILQPDGKPDFVCDAPSTGDAIFKLWFAEKVTPETSYFVHEGRHSKGQLVSAAEAYWSLAASMRVLLTAVLKETSTAAQFSKYCETVVDIFKLREEL